MAISSIQSTSTGAFEASRLSTLIDGWEESPRSAEVNTNFGVIGQTKTSFSTLNDTLRTSTLILAGLCIGFFISSVLVIAGLI